jgi:transcription factor STE12
MLIRFRHRRTHEPRADGEPLSSFDEDELEGEDENLHSLGDESPESIHDYLSGIPNIPASLSDMPLSMGTTMGPPQQLIAAHNY